MDKKKKGHAKGHQAPMLNLKIRDATLFTLISIFL
jgi:hypothetical protein